MSFSPHSLKIPKGFETLLEGLCREVLREQPEDIIQFASEYFIKRLESRDGGEKAVKSQTHDDSSEPIDDKNCEEVQENPSPSNALEEDFNPERLNNVEGEESLCNNENVSRKNGREVEDTTAVDSPRVEDTTSLDSRRVEETSTVDSREVENTTSLDSHRVEDTTSLDSRRVEETSTVDSPQVDDSTAVDSPSDEETPDNTDDCSTDLDHSAEQNEVKDETGHTQEVPDSSQQVESNEEEKTDRNTGSECDPSDT